MSEQRVRGSCLCGAARYVATGEAQHFYHCHCKRCRKATGSAHASNLFLQGSLDWKSGEELVKFYKLPQAKRFGNTFCTQCGGRLPRFIEASGMVFIPAGSLDEEPGIEPEARIFTASGADWCCGGDMLRTFDEYPS